MREVAVAVAGKGRRRGSPHVPARWLVMVCLVGSFAIAAPLSARATFPGENGRIFFHKGKNIYSMSPANPGAGSTLVARGAAFPGRPKLANVSVSPNGRRIAFSAGGSNIWIGTPGSGARNVTRAFSNRQNLTSLRYPAWSPNGQRLVFQAVKEGPGSGVAGLYRINVDGTGGVRIVKFPQFALSYATHPDWSSQGKIAYGAHNDLFLVNPDGSGKTNLTDDQGLYVEPSWSPDGEQIAVDHEVDGSFTTPGIVILDATTGEVVTEVTGNEACCDEKFDSPSWSPDGQEIAFRGFPSGDDTSNYDLYTVPVTGGHMSDMNMTSDADSGLDVREPAWGPKP